MSGAALGVMLLIGAVQDLRSKTIRAELILVPGLVSALSLICREGPDFLPGALAGLVPGACLFFLSRVSRGAIGEGDALIVGLLGFSLGIWQALGIMMLAFFGAALCVCLLLLLRRADRNTKLPFVPFLAAAYLLSLVLG